MKSSDTTSPDESNNETSNLEEPNAQPERFDMSVITEVPKWQRILKAIDLPVQFVRIGILALIIWVWETRWIFKGWSPFSFLGWDYELFPEIVPLFQGIPSEAGEFLFDIWDDSLFWSDFWVTLQEALLGFVIGSGLGFIVGLLLGSFRKVAKVLSPFLIFTNAVKKIFDIKQRPPNTPVPIFIEKPEDLEHFTTQKISDDIKKITNRFWPGALTAILKKSEKIPEITVSGLDSAGFRIPDHEVPIQLCKLTKSPITGTSANISGKKAARSIQDISKTKKCI